MVNAGWMAVYGKEAQSGRHADAGAGAAERNRQDRERGSEGDPDQTAGAVLGSDAARRDGERGKTGGGRGIAGGNEREGLGNTGDAGGDHRGFDLREIRVAQLGRELQPTAKAFSIITLLRGLDIPELCSPELTGNWEFKLRQMSARTSCAGPIS